MKSPINGAGKTAPMVGIVGVSLVLGFALGRVTLSPNRDLAEVTIQKGATSEAVEDRADWKGAGSSEDLSVGAFASVAAIGNPRDRDRALQESLSKSTLSDIKKALSWAESLPDGSMKRAALAKILERWGQLDGPGAVAYASQVYAETGSASLLREALQGWATKNPQAAIEQISALGLSDGLQRDFRRDLLEQWTDQNPAGATGYALANRNPDSWRGGVGTVAEQWSKQDPKSAANWVASLDSGKDKSNALQTVISNWMKEDLNGAAFYVSSQSSGETRDTMAGTLARYIGREDPSSGLKWAAMVADPNLQQRAVIGALSDLYRKDASQAQRVLQSSGIGAEVQQSAWSRMTNRGSRR
jgi:hypothetical protein